MNEETIDQVILNSVSATHFSRQQATTDAYIEGAHMMYEFLQYNPRFLKSDEVEEIIQWCLFPSKINKAI